MVLDPKWGKHLRVNPGMNLLAGGGKLGSTGLVLLYLGLFGLYLGLSGLVTGLLGSKALMAQLFNLYR